jgi:hypothetical protein
MSWSKYVEVLDPKFHWLEVARELKASLETYGSPVKEHGSV